MKYYQQVVNKDVDYVDVIYSIGVLYYNKVVVMIQDFNKYVDDYFKEGLKKYEEFKKSIFEEFDNVLLFFQKVELINFGDLNMFIVFKEIYVCKDDLEKFNVFKECIDCIQVGEMIEDVYFDK